MYHIGSFVCQHWKVFLFLVYTVSCSFVSENCVIRHPANLTFSFILYISLTEDFIKLLNELQSTFFHFKVEFSCYTNSYSRVIQFHPRAKLTKGQLDHFLNLFILTGRVHVALFLWVLFKLDWDRFFCVDVWVVELVLVTVTM